MKKKVAPFTAAATISIVNKATKTVISDFQEYHESQDYDVEP